ncbi:MAG: phosphoribosylaminoimidazolesuccinocarboxamide synthase [Promicromonosporaceae bacterium]|nr:phosphoribosylaminoimidazolesuccinocarboxamide synthase [Promicromonosporaceae bacterium]
MSSPAYPGWRHVYSGKVRDLYEPTDGDDDVVMIVASDRISAFDRILEPAIVGKGAILTSLSNWWFDQLEDLVPVHRLAGYGQVDPRAMVCKRLDMFPVECVARGYLTGSGLAEYRATGEVTGIPLPPGLTEGSRLPEPIFTPARKAELGEHDENVSFEAVVDMIGAEAAAELRRLTIAIYQRAEAVARARGLILADTKFEFGRDRHTGEITLGDEVLTPDSSRFWPLDEWLPGRGQPSFDKQYVRDWLASPASGWDPASDLPPPPLPDAVVQKTRARYAEAYQALTGAA